MIHLAVPNLNGNESRYLQECVSTNYVSSVGPFVTRFEKQIAAAAQSKCAVTTSSGTTALHMALLAAGVRPNDLVIVPSFTFIASANSISHCQATPWLMDIEEQGWTLDPQQLRRELEGKVSVVGGDAYHRPSGRRIGALMPVHVLGNPADMDTICRLAAEFSIPVVTDGAAALGATYRGGALHAPGTLTTFSFNGNKTITCGGGGAVAGADEKQIEFIRHISSTARNAPAYDHDQVGYNFRMTNIQAAVGCAQIERLAAFVQRKREVDRFYRDNLSGLPLTPFARPSWGESACWFSGVVLDHGDAGELCAKLAARGIEARPFWKPVHLQTPYASAPRAALTRTERLWNRIVTLPCSTSITDQELLRVGEAVQASWRELAA